MGRTTTDPLRRQKRIILASVVAFAVSALAVPGLIQQGARANGTGNPYSCGTGGTDDSYRNSFGLSVNATSTNTSGTITPCISGAEYRLSLPQPSSGDAATVTGVVKMDSGSNVKLANGSTVSLFHIAFANFSILTTANNPVLKTVGGTAAAGSQGAYSLSLTPDPAGAKTSPPVIGGNGVQTDLWVTSNSTFVVDLSGFGTFSGIACGLAGGSGSSSCTVTVSSMSSSMVQLMNEVGISTLSIYSMNLDFYYLVTHNTSGGVPSGIALQFPRSTLQVTPSS